MKDSKSARLDKLYSRNLKKLNKEFFKSKETGLLLFIEYLRYLRDALALTVEEYQKLENSKIETDIATLTVALAEFNAYKNCQDEDKKAFHWKTFCDLIKLNMEEWLQANDSI